ncbi:MAG: insulinase family protein [Pontibacterium sp.]
MTVPNYLTLKFIASLCLLLFVSNFSYATVIKSPNDQRQYLDFTLPNTMKVLVISDPDSKKAAASLNVGVGSNANPEARAGLAHFLEHMLFLGTEKYPQAGEYQRFISAHGGSHNAYTAFENTNYFFDITADHLTPALDRFAQFFISPLFTEKYVNRERNAVHSEYQAKIRDDGRRSYAVTKQVFNPHHSYSQFTVGSLETLADTKESKVRDDLIRFYQQYYSANLMTLVVLGPQSVDALKMLVEEKFSAVPDRQATAYVNPVSLFKKDQLPQQLNIKTLKDLRYLSLTFPLPEVRSHWRTKPLSYIGSLVGYEGAGSLLSALKTRGWATGLSASTGIDLPAESSFQVTISLTPEGLKHQQAITRLFFEYIALIKKGGVQQALYLEESQLSQIQFRFQERSEPMQYVSHLSHQLHRYPADEVIRAPYRLETFDATLIQSYLSHITPENMLQTAEAREVETNQQDPWYNAEFQSAALSQAQVTMLKHPLEAPDLFIRGKNPFVAGNLDLKTQESTKPQSKQQPEVLLQKEGLTLWHHQDNSFKTPRANLFFSVMSDQANQSARAAVLTSLYTRMVKEQLNESLYDAYIAGLSTDIYPHLKGFSVRLSGYNDKLPVLLEQVVRTLKTPAFTADRFRVIKQQYSDQLANAKKDKPFNQTINEIFQLLLPRWSNKDKQDALALIHFEDLQAFAPLLLAETELRILSHGNLHKDDATGFATTIARHLLTQAKTKPLADTPVVLLDKNRSFTQTLDLPHNDSAISVYFQGSDSRVKTRAEFAVLSELMSSPFYNRLRTEQQLGYVVFETPLPLQKAPGLAFVVQSPTTDPLALEAHINNFIHAMDKQIQALDNNQLEGYKRSVISRVLKDENSLSARTVRYWHQIDRNKGDFLSREALAKAISALSLADIHKSFTTLNERRLTVRSFGMKHRQAISQTEILKQCETDIKVLKATGKYMPDA